jgi:hypothetical protein
MIDWIAEKVIQALMLVALVILSPIIIYAMIKEEVEFRKSKN